MSRIDELIAEHCPDGVEFKSLSEIAVRNKGINITAGKMKEIHKEGGEIRIFAGGRTTADVDETDLPEGTIIEEPSIIVKSRGHIGFEYFEGRFTHKSELWSYSSRSDTVNLKFVYYYLSTKVDYFQDLAKSTSVKLPQLGVADTDSFRIPVPPISVQEEIVRVLDKFTRLEAELEVELKAELEARRRQYQHYRDELLTFTKRGGVRLLALSEVGSFIRGNGLQKKDLLECGLPAVHYGQIHTKYGVWFNQPLSYVEDSLFSKLRKANPGDLIIATTSEDSEAVGKAAAWMGDEPIAVSGDSFIFRHSMNPKFVSYFFQSEHFYQQKKRFVTGTKVRRISASDLGKIKIPVYDREEQDRIVGVLDCFNDLVADISIGLPAELQARRKQYEYYRDKLLTFKER